jgi:copper chaperone NosL
MGPTIASFSVEQDAQNFITAEGGKLYRFEQVTSDLISLDGGALHDQHGM